MTHSGRIRRSLWLLSWALVAALLQAILGWQLTSRSVLRTLQDELLVEIDFLSILIQPLEDPAMVRSQLETLAAIRSSRIEIWTPEGKLWAAAGARIQRDETLEREPPEELQVARRHGQATVIDSEHEPPLLWATAVVRGAQGAPYLVRLGRPAAALPALRRDLGLTILVAVLAASFVAALGGWIVTRNLLRPLARLSAAATSLAHGSLGTSLPDIPKGDLRVLANSLQKLSLRLENLRAAQKDFQIRLACIVESLEEGVLILDAQNRIELVNARFHELLGIAAGTANENLLELLRIPEFHRALEEARQTRTLASRVLTLPTVGRQLELRCTPLPPNDTWLVTVNDLTSEHRAEAIRRDFVANVSHELRTPVTALQGWTETLGEAVEEGDLPTVRRAAQRVLAQTQRLQLLLDELLTLSRLEMGLSSESFEEIRWPELIAEAVELLEHEASARQVSVIVEPGPPTVLVGHRPSLLRLVTNVLENAIKYNRPAGSARLSWRVVGSELLFEVSDTGVGIPSADLPRIFERFFRVERGRSRNEGGTGLGLAIVKHVAHAHGGRLDVESQLGTGSTFRIFLPLPGQRPTSAS